MSTKYNRKSNSYFGFRKLNILNNTLKDSKLIIKASGTIIVYTVFILFGKIDKLTTNIIIVFSISRV